LLGVPPAVREVVGGLLTSELPRAMLITDGDRVGEVSPEGLRGVKEHYSFFKEHRITIVATMGSGGPPPRTAAESFDYVLRVKVGAGGPPNHTEIKVERSPE
jgi:hypothetical protein